MRIIIFIALFFQTLSFAQELKIISAEEFLKQNPSLERKAIVDFITHQFNDKRDIGVTQAQLEGLWNDMEARNTYHLMRFQIVNQKLYADSYDINQFYFKPYFRYLQNFLKKYKVKDVDFIIYGRDEIVENALQEKTLDVLGFMMSKNINSKYEKDKLLIPDAWMIREGDESFRSLVPKLSQASNIYPWESKENKVFWRGGAHGAKEKYYYNISNFDKLPRLSLVIFSKLYPQLIDARLTSYTEFSKDEDGENLKIIMDLLSIKSQARVNEEDHLKYKYLISIDGNTCPWMRVPWIMLSNSILLKQETENIEWFYSALKPMVHYVPINKNLTSLFEQIDWLKTHDNEAEQISNNATNFIKSELMPEHIDVHLAIILNEYAGIQKDSQIKITLPSEEEVMEKIRLREQPKPKKKKSLISRILSLKS
ncbi:MAG: glycosyl transferase family 90 [Pseudomonadota bacterium]